MSSGDTPVITVLVPVLAIIMVAIADFACHVELVTRLARKRVFVTAAVTWAGYYLSVGVRAATHARLLETIVSGLVTASAAWWATRVQSRPVVAE